MYGYKIKINSLPKLLWACETTVNDYVWENRNRKDALEISFSKFNTKTVISEGKTYMLKNSALSCIVADEKIESFCEPGSPITIVSVAVSIINLEYTCCNITEADCEDASYLLIPLFIEQLPLADELDLIKSLHKIIKFSADCSESKNMAFYASFYELLYKVDLITRKSYAKNKNTNYYIKKIDYLLECKYNQKLTLDSIASELNISPVYLSTLYKKLKGINISDQLLNIRMKHAEKLLLDQNIPTAKVASLCGFCDETYFRKKFKQYFGMNVREYRQIKNSLTLYHPKPQKGTNPSHPF